METIPELKLPCPLECDCWSVKISDSPDCGDSPRVKTCLPSSFPGCRNSVGANSVGANIAFFRRSDSHEASCVDSGYQT